jgi:predicted DNA binding CopG/RHH family protein
MSLKMPKFKSESEEADWWYANRKEVERELRNAQPVTDASGKPMSPVEIAKGYAAKQTQAISLRLPAADIELAKKQASARGIGYQTLIRMILHESLHGAQTQKKQGAWRGRPAG